MNNNTGLEHESRNATHRQKHFRAHVHGTNWISARFNYGKSRYNSVSFFPPHSKLDRWKCRASIQLNVRVKRAYSLFDGINIYIHTIYQRYTFLHRRRERTLTFSSWSINFQIRTKGEWQISRG